MTLRFHIIQVRMAIVKETNNKPGVKLMLVILAIWEADIGRITV
jgi:hypothetical protein